MALVFVLVIIQGTGAGEKDDVVFLDLTFNRRINYPLIRPGPLPHGDGLGHCVNVIVLVFGAVVHGAREGIDTAVVVCVLGLGGYVRLQWAGAAGLL